MHEKRYNQARNLTVFFRPEWVCIQVCCSAVPSAQVGPRCSFAVVAMSAAGSAPAQLGADLCDPQVNLVPASSVYLVLLNVTDPSKLHIIKN